MTPLVMLMPWVTQIIPATVGTAEVLVSGHWKGTSDMVVWVGYERAQCAAVWLVTVVFLVRAVVMQGAGGLLPFAVAGVIYYAFAQVSHINDASFQKPTSPEWAAEQIAATAGDYGYDSVFWNLMSLGLNNQAFHHCFPTVHPCHHPALSQLMRPVFDKHALSMAGWEQNYWDSLRNHVQHIWILNRQRTPSDKRAKEKKTNWFVDSSSLFLRSTHTAVLTPLVHLGASMRLFNGVKTVVENRKKC